jgi:hypothetical protein
MIILYTFLLENATPVPSVYNILWYWTQIGQFRIEHVFILKLGLLDNVKVKKVNKLI